MFQNLNLGETAEMPSYDLPDTVYEKWMQMSGRRGTCLYVATIDNIMRAIMQSIDYEAFWKVAPCV